MPRPALFLLVLAGLLTSAGCATERSSSSGSPPQSVALPEILASAYEHRADGSLTLFDRLGEPQRVETEPVVNRHDPSQTDTLRTFHYSGLALEVYAVTGGKEILQEVRVTGEGYETTEGLRVGSTREAIRAALGPPVRSEDGRLSYEVTDTTEDPTPTTLTIRFEGDRVDSMAWSFYVD